MIFLGAKGDRGPIGEPGRCSQGSGRPLRDDPNQHQPQGYLQQLEQLLPRYPFCYMFAKIFKQVSSFIIPRNLTALSICDLEMAKLYLDILRMNERLKLMKNIS